MELKIYDKQGLVKMTVSPDNSSQWDHEVGVENVVTVNFTTWEFLVLEVGWYILVEGQRFSIKSEYRPKHIHDTKYTYNLKFYGREHDAQDILFCRLNQGEDDLESVFAYDGTPMDLLWKVVANMNRNTDGVVWKAGEAISANRQTINFNGLYCWDALGEISRAFGTEWWMDGEYLNISKCERGESVSLGYGQGLKSGLTQNENTNAVKWFTRLIPVGSSKNIDKSKYGYNTLQLPGREKYIDINTQYGLKEYREEAAFSEIYPHRVGAISSVRSEERTNEETGNYTVYYVKDSSLPFNPDEYMIGGEVIHMTFNSGVLAGKDFEVNWNNETKEFEIINQYPDEKTQLPGGNLVPSADDTYVLWNISMPDEYIRAAEQELKTAVDVYLAEYSKDISVYSGSTDYIYISKNDVPLLLGQRVRLLSEVYFGNIGRDSRITRVSRKLNNLNEATIDCSDAIASSWKSSVDSSLNQLQFAVSNEMAQALIQILKTGEPGTPSDYNVLSALRSLNTFLRKDKDDRSKGKIATEKAIEVGNYVSGASGAIIYKDMENGQTVGELDKLYVRMKAYFETLEIINVNTVGGKQILSPAGSIKCIGVSETENEYLCYFLAEQDGEKVKNRWQQGDQAYSQTFNAKEGVSNKVSNTYYWRLVTSVSNDAVEFEGKQCHFVGLSKTDCDKGSDIPNVGDIINHRGSRTDVDRMNFIEQSSVDAFSPNITLFHGVNSYSLDGKEYVSYGVDKFTNKAFMNVYGDMYVGDRQGDSYMRYTQENGLEISGTLSVGTKLGDKDLQELIESATPEGYQEFVDKVTQDIEGLQNQIDGAIESYFYQYDPTLGNYPAFDWVSNGTEKAHLNDTFTNLVSGRSWRWSLDGTTYKWVEITDTAAAEALRIAGEAADTADGKRRVFVETPYPPYDKGDLWSGGSDTFLKICINTRATGVYDPTDWDYADKTAKIEENITTFDYLKEAMKEDTTIEGGLIQSSTLMLGYTDAVGQFNVMSGTNGIFNQQSHGGGIASWWGGGLHDLLDYYTWDGDTWQPKANVTIPTNIPSGLIRMDGTGYLAKGKFWWDNEGKIYADPTALFLMFDVEDEAQSLSSTILAMRDKQAEFESMWSIKTDANGKKYLYSTFDLVTQGGISMYTNAEGLNLPSIYNGLPIDGQTIYWENGVLKAKGGSGIVGATTLGGLSNVGTWADSVADVDRIMYQAANSSQWVSKNLSDLELKGDYLPLSGGTLTGNLTIGDSSNTVSKALVFNRSGIGMQVSTNDYRLNLIYKSTENINTKLVIGDNLLLYYYNSTPYTIFHSGNFTPSNYLLASTYTASDILTKLKTVDGSGSGLDADTLDGHHASQFIGLYTREDVGTTINFDNPHVNGFFEMRAERETTSTGIRPFDGWAPFLSIKSENVMLQIAGKNANGWWIRGIQKGNATLEGVEWQQLARTTDNVASATKLETPRTIWGQSFDGSGDVNGDLSFTKDAFIKAPDGSTALYINNSNTILGYGNCSASKYTYIDGYSVILRYGTSHAEGMRLTSSGNVLIGTTTDSGQKLRVHGSIYANNYGANNNRSVASIIINKGGNPFGIGSSSNVKNLGFGVCNSDATWISEWMTITDNGKIGINQTSPAYYLDVNGNARIDGIPIYKKQDGVLYIEGNLAVKGGITMFAEDEINIPSIIDSLPIASTTAKGIASFDSNFFSVGSDGKVTFIGQTGGGVADSVAWSGITGKPTTLSGYGITDAKISNGVITLGGSTITPLTSHQTIYNLTLQEGSFSAVTFDPNGAAKTVNIPTTTSHISEGTNLYYTDARAQAAITGGASTIKTTNLTKSRALISNSSGKVAVSAVTSTELGYLDGVTSAIQTQLNGKLSLAGGELTGHLGINVSVKNTGFSISYNGTTMGSLITNGSTFEMFNTDGYGITTLGTNLYALAGWNKYTLWHSGNDGSGSGLDADLLDGLDSSRFVRQYGVFYNANEALNAGTYRFHETRTGLPDGATNYGTLFVAREDSADTLWQIYGNYNNDGLFYRRGNITGIPSNSWKQIAFTDSNVASATKLQTTRTIWGQSFDGTGNVYGDLVVYGTSENNTNAAAGKLWFNGIPNAGYGNGVYITGIHHATYGRKRLAIYQSNDASYTPTWNEVFTILPNGNVGIGTISPSQKLDVNGTISIKEYISVGDNRFIYHGKSSSDASTNLSIIASGSEAGGAVQIRPYHIDYENNATTFLSNGNVGIGTTNPKSKLHVAGDFISYGVYGENGGSVPANYWWGLYQWDGKIQMTRRNTSNTYESEYFYIDVASKNIVFSGGITMYSDKRKKTILNHVELSLKDIANAPLIEHYYNSDDKKTTHVGSIAQYWASMNDWFCKLDSEGFYTMEIQNCALASAISIARELDRYETETDKTIKQLKKRICQLEEEVERLKSA